MDNIRIVIIIGFFLLIIALINFINLTIANSFTRLKEIGIRKLNGAGKFHLIARFAGEATLVLFAALLVSLLMVEAFSADIYRFAGVETGTTLLSDPLYLVLLVPAIILLGVITGFYPAYILGKPQITSIFRGEKVTGAHSKFGIKKGLVIVQFVIAIILITATLVVEGQLLFMRTSGFGFDEKNVMQVNLLRSSDGTPFPLDTFKAGLNKIPGVKDFTASFGSPFGSTVYSSVSENATGAIHEAMFNYTEPNYPGFFGMRLLAGKYFTENSTPRNDVVINETLMKILGYSDPAGIIGKSPFRLMRDEVTITGVVKDFHVASFREAIPPVVLLYKPKQFTTLFIKLNEKDIPATIESIRQKWDEINPEYPLTYSFADETIENLYSDEKKQAGIVFAVSIIAVIISAMGLFGLSAITARQRIKEIGIRKVTGATSKDIVVLFTKETVILILIANVIALPAAWYYTNGWLKNFAYRIDIGFLLLLAVFLISFVTGLISVSYQALKASLADPVKSLRYE